VIKPTFQAVTQDSAETKHPEFTNFSEKLPFVLTKRELANLLSCTERHIDNLSRRGVLPSVRLGRTVRFRRDAVLASIRKLEGGHAA
jgi:excisionase family DNA binding protein